MIFALTLYVRARTSCAAAPFAVLIGSEAVPPPSIAELTCETRKYYQGPLIVGDDLMSFDVGAEIKVTHRHCTV